MDWVKAAEDVIYTHYMHVCGISGRDAAAESLNISPAFDVTEARDFMQGLGADLFDIDDEGYVQSCLLPSPSGKNTRQKMLQLFWRKNGGRILFREGVCQLATVSSLVLTQGWDMGQVIMEPGVAEFGDLAYGVDILIRDKDHGIVICGEVKKSAAEFEKLISGFKHCCARGRHAKADCDFPQNHAKYEFCMAIRPSHFFAAAPGKTICFTLEHGASMSIGSVSRDLPRREQFS